MTRSDAAEALSTHPDVLYHVEGSLGVALDLRTRALHVVVVCNDKAIVAGSDARARRRADDRRNERRKNKRRAATASRPRPVRTPRPPPAPTPAPTTWTWRGVTRPL